GIKVVSGSTDKTVRVWNAADGKSLLTIPALPAGVAAVAVAGDNALAAAGLTNGFIKVFDITVSDATKAERASYRGSTGPTSAVAFLPDAKALLTASADKVVELWTLPSAGGSKSFAGHTGQVYGVAWSPDGKVVATG